MTADKNQQPKSTLLPVSGPLLPPSGSGDLLNLDASSGEAFASEVSDQLHRAGAEAKELASKAAALAVEKAPEIKRKAQEATIKMGEIASRAIKEAEASANAASATLADPQKRQAAIHAYKKKAGIGLVVGAVVLGGGFAFAKHQATLVAKDQIDGFLIRNKLQSSVTYDGLSASPFGSVTLSGITFKGPQSRSTFKIETLNVSGVEMKGGMVQGITASAKSFELPLLDFARDNPRDSTYFEALGLGYTTITGNLNIEAHFDDQRQTLSLETSGDIKDSGSLKATLKLGGISPALMTQLNTLSQAVQSNNPFAVLGTGIDGMMTITQMTLSQASITVDNSGLFKRQQEVTNADIPPDETATPQADQSINETELVKAGMLPSEAKATHEAVSSWLKNGGTIRIETNLAQPISLFRGGSWFAPAFDSPAGYLVATKSKISN